MIHPLQLTIFTCILGLVPALASADEPSIRDWARQQIQTGLVAPLVHQEDNSARFTRSRQPPRERKVRVMANTLSKDSKGREFVPFVVDTRYGSEWQVDIVGCIYRKSSEIFVERGNEYRPAAFLLGKNVKAVSGVCRAASES